MTEFYYDDPDSGEIKKIILFSVIHNFVVRYGSDLRESKEFNLPGDALKYFKIHESKPNVQLLYQTSATFEDRVHHARSVPITVKTMNEIIAGGPLHKINEAALHDLVCAKNDHLGISPRGILVSL